MLADLHTHTTASDGKLSPAELLAAAAAAGITLLAITDHDTVAAYDRLTGHERHGLDLVGGVEFSTWWQRHGVHVLGLNVNLHSAELRAACARQFAARDERARAIGARLARAGIADTYLGAASCANGGAIGRPHFAQHLINIGAVKNHAEAFKRFLGGRHDAGGFDHWPPLTEVVASIRAAGGTAVLAHPAKYKLTRSRLAALTAAFQDAGGEALEVISGAQQRDVTQHLAQLASAHGLAASAGSDFHQPGLAWAALGRLAPLPADLEPVWERW